MPTVGQKEIFKRPEANLRKIVLATNIAETSITIDDIVFVIDCGKIKMSNFDVKENITTLKPEWVSLANARQRRGRAGRVQPGTCYHMFTKAREMILDSYLLPEMLRKRLEEVILQVKILGLGHVRPFFNKVMDSPDVKAIDLSLDLLNSINAINDQEQLTPLGFHLAQLPMDPQTGKMILLGAIFSCLDPILSVAASLSFKDAFIIPLGKEHEADEKRAELAGTSRSDHLMMANVFSLWEQNQGSKAFCYDFFLSESTLKMLSNLRRQFAQQLCDKQFIQTPNPKDKGANLNSNNEALVRAVICAGLYPNVGRIVKKVNKKFARHGDKNDQFVILKTNQEKRVELHPKSVNSQEIKYDYPWMVYHLKMKSSKVYLYDSSMVSPLSLVFFGKNLTKNQPNNGQSITVTVDNFVKFRCDKKTFYLVSDLRTALNELLEYKICNPGGTNWRPESKEGALLNAIVRLLTSEIDPFETKKNIGGIELAEEEEDEDGFSD